jgi:hypothetical protein
MAIISIRQDRPRFLNFIAISFTLAAEVDSLIGARGRSRRHRGPRGGALMSWAKLTIISNILPLFVMPGKAPPATPFG